MLARWLPILCASLLLASCGSSNDSTAAQSPTATPTETTATATATATATVESPDLERMPQVPEASGTPPSSATSGRQAFLRGVFDDAEAMWKREFEGAGLDYQPARLTIFTHAVHTACGTQSAEVGPFYCPADSGVYLDTTFFTALSAKAGVELGDFAQAYVVAHEVAHHVQVLLGTSHRVAAADQQDPEGKNARSVRVELQAAASPASGRTRPTDAEI